MTDDGISIGALVAVNSLGSPLMPGSDVFWAFAFEQNGEFGGRRPQRDLSNELDLPADMKGALPSENTTLAIIAVDAEVSAVELSVSRSWRPTASRELYARSTCHSMATSSSLSRRRALCSRNPRQRSIMRLGSIAADCGARAVARGVYEAVSLGAMKSYRDFFATR